MKFRKIKIYEIYDTRCPTSYHKFCQFVFVELLKFLIQMCLETKTALKPKQQIT